MGKTIKKNAKAKKAAVKAKIAERKAKLKAKFAALVALLCVGLLGGCALERADPAARSNRATYTISVVAEGGSTATAYISDGLMATADGEGAITQPATLTTEQSPDVTVPGDAVTAGIQAIGHVTGKAIDAYAAKASGEKAKSQLGSDSVKGASDAGACPDGNCEAGDCADGSCTTGACTDGSCNP